MLSRAMRKATSTMSRIQGKAPPKQEALSPEVEEASRLLRAATTMLIQASTIEEEATTLMYEAVAKAREAEMDYTDIFATAKGTYSGLVPKSIREKARAVISFYQRQDELARRRR
jgi:hypothetical protein